METQNGRAMGEPWAARLEDLGLASVVAALLDAARPLAPLGAGLLWIAQPALGAVVGRERVASWAGLLEDPANLARLSARLAGEEPDEEPER